MKHRESEQTQLRVSRLLNRDSVMLHAEMPSVQTALEPWWNFRRATA